MASVTRRPQLAFDREHTGDRQTDAIWSALDEIARRLNESQVTQGRVLTEEDGAEAGSGLKFVSGVARSFPHKLGRKATGFLEIYSVDVPSAARVGLFPSAHPKATTSDTHVTVTPTSTGACWLMVF